ncbi:MAG: tRNA pseudouridine(55) synthase TruB [Planctomycetes bacterium]|nr:tRNA pseudouridine(55) synthase TruB [Planctomycetota bacterium]
MTRSFDGLLVLDKPGGMTSRDAVDRALRWFPRGTRVGHTGTLDPLATGVLVLCVGSATRLTEYVQQMAKTYQTTVRLGARSDTDDADGTVTPVAEAVAPTREQLEACLQGFLGEIEQVPPAFSAAKVTGQRAYDLARRGDEVTLQPRKVSVYGIDVRRYDYPEGDLEVRCGKGTYIRSLARDLGERLGCGGLVQMLRRTRVGPFHCEDAVPLDADPEAARSRLLPLTAAVADLPLLTMPAPAVAQLRQGRAIPSPGRLPEANECAIVDEDGVLVAIARVDRRARLLRPIKVLP